MQGIQGAAPSSQSDDFLQFVISSAPVVLFAINAEGIFTLSCGKGLEKLGLRQGELVGQSVFELYRDYPWIIEGVRKGLAGEEFVSEGEVQGLWFRTHHAPQWDKKGNIIGLIGVATDITEHKKTEEQLRQSEEHFRVLVEASPHIVWTARPDGFVDYFNHHWFKYTGASLQDSFGEGWGHSIHPEDLPKVNEIWRNALKTGEHFCLSCRILKRDGNYKWHDAYGTALQDSKGQVVKWIGITMDVDERRKAEFEREQRLKEERQAKENAERNNREKDVFLAVLSHELKTPLSAILTWAQLLKSGRVMEEQAQKGLSVIEKNALEQSRLINDLLDVSKIILGKMGLECSEIDLSSVIQSVLDSFRPQIEGKNIRLQMKFEVKSLMICGDSHRLWQVFSNLITNSIKFTPPGGELEITQDFTGSFARVQVRDTGRGISAQFLPHVFDFFTQMECPESNKSGGLGLGLAISRRLVELHGGKISAESAGEGKGATFTVLLPKLLSPFLRKK